MAEVLSKLEKAAIAVTDEVDGRGMNVLAPWTLVTGGLSGIAVYNGVKKLGFPSSSVYESAHNQVKSANTAIADLEKNQDQLDKLGVNGVDTQISSRIEHFQASAAEAKTHYPDDYNPHVEGFISGGSAIAVAGIVMYGMYTRISRGANNAKAKLSTQNPDETL